MRFTRFGGFLQLRPWAEGGVLNALGLLHIRESDHHVHVHSTAQLRALFVVDPPMEDLYPVLVEFVMRFRHPELVDVADVERRLRTLGMTGAALEQLQTMLARHLGFWDDDRLPRRLASGNPVDVSRKH